MKRFAFVASFAASALVVPGSARASEVDVCIDAADRSQPLRAAGKLRAARALLNQCVRPVCPAAVRASCKGWLTEVDTVLPTVLLRARDASGKALADVRVTADLELVAEKLDDSPVRLDPGEHVLRFEHEGETVEQRVVLVSGERDRVVTAVFRAPQEAAAPTPTPAPTPAPAPAPEQPVRERRSVPALSWILGGAGIAAGGVATVFYVRGLHDGSSLRDACGNTQVCTESDRSGVRTKLIAGDVLAGVAIVALAAAVWIALTSHDDARPVTAGLRR